MLSLPALRRLRSGCVVAVAVATLSAADASAQTRGATRFARSPDGTRLAFDVIGSGPPILLLHGGGQTRRAWHDAGYVARLAPMFRVITMDFRGSGESDAPTTKEAYAIEKLIADVLAVADAAQAPRFSLWGFSYGANIGRYVARRSPRVSSMLYIGIPFGPAADPMFRDVILERLRDSSTPPVEAAWMSALLDYPPVEPADLRCPTLWLVGTRNAGAMASVVRYESRLPGTRVRLQRLDGLTHADELRKIDVTFPQALMFMRTTPP